jgi:hypothetical protein
MIPACKVAAGPDRIRVGRIDAVGAANAAAATLLGTAFDAKAELS